MSRSTARRARWAAVPLTILALAGAATSCSGGDGGAAGDERPIASVPPAGTSGTGTTGTEPTGTQPVGTQPVDTQPSTTAPTTLPPPPPPPSTGGPRPTSAPTAGCPSIEIVTARGTGESQTAAMGLSGLNQGIASQVPGTTTYQVVYPASADFLNSAGAGTQDALAHLRAKAGQCANTRFFLTGYSQGGMVMTGVFQKIGDLAPRIIGGVLYGNPYYKGSSPTASGPDRAAMGIIPGTGIPASWGGKVHDYCAQGDTVCGSGTNGAVGLPQGISAQHLSYPRSALERDAIAWAVGLIKGS
jgi:cutinase